MINEEQQQGTQEQKGLSLTQVLDKEGLREGIKSDGTRYSVRDFRNRYFFPDEWKEFLKRIKQGKVFIFELLMMTGARIEEALCIKESNLREDRKYLTLFVTKIKAKKKETKPTPRDIVLSSQFIKKMKKYIQENNIKEGQYLFLDNSKVYNTRAELKKETKSKAVAISQMMKRALKKSGIKDYWNFSLHNIRKTHGMYLKAMDIKFEEICKRLGHDANTYLKHYGSSDVFTRADKQEIIKILGDVYGLSPL